MFLLQNGAVSPLLLFLPCSGVCYSYRHIARQMRKSILMKTNFPHPSPGPAFSLINLPGVDHLGWSCENRNGSEGRSRLRTEIIW